MLSSLMDGTAVRMGIVICVVGMDCAASDASSARAAVEDASSIGADAEGVSAAEAYIEDVSVVEVFIGLDLI